ncbi:hypothetical protein HYT59_02465 [Candidatus Woesebacteria bacterium]|nr:hypothetical protein [Candidatus Woesebacteria bacterium]
MFKIYLTVFAAVFTLGISAATLKATDTATTTTTEKTTTSEATPKPSASPTTTKTEEAIKERLETMSLEEKAKRLEEIRLEAKKRWELKKADFKENVAVIKVEKRKLVLEKLVEKFNAVNNKWVDHWEGILNKLSQILDKVDARAEKLTSEGIDTSTYKTAAATARAKIAEAVEALEDQAADTYVFDADTETEFGTQVKSIPTLFKADVQATHELVKEAREGVNDAFAALKALKSNE